MTRSVKIATMASTDKAILAMGSVVKSAYNSAAEESRHGREGVVYI